MLLITWLQVLEQVTACNLVIVQHILRFNLKFYMWAHATAYTPVYSFNVCLILVWKWDHLVPSLLCGGVK